MPQPLPHSVRQLIVDEGFVLLGVAPAVDALEGSPASGAGRSAGRVIDSPYAVELERLRQWIDAGYAGGMDYLSKRWDAYADPERVLEGVRSVMVVARPYPADGRHPADQAANDYPDASDYHDAGDYPSAGDHSDAGGRVARYAWSGVDYHDVMHGSLKRIVRHLCDAAGGRARGVVDTAPLLERWWAERSGLGWRAKNTLMINRRWGSYLFLAAILSTQSFANESVGDPPTNPDGHCGTCTACLDACPTDAFVQAGVLDAKRCISYLTIEHRGRIDPSLRESIGDWVFGCDVCQEVCPWNRRRARAIEAAPMATLSLQAMLTIDDAEFRRRYRKTPFWRTRRSGMARNAAIVVGNTRPPGGVRWLSDASADPDPVVRGTVAWALAQYVRRSPNALDPPAASKALKMMVAQERDPDVSAELLELIQSINPSD